MILPTIQEFIDDCCLPQDWEEIVRLEALTGCSVCEKRLLDNGRLKPGTAALRVYDSNNVLQVVYVLCKDHAPPEPIT